MCHAGEIGLAEIWKTLPPEPVALGGALNEDEETRSLPVWHEEQRERLRTFGIERLTLRVVELPDE